MGRLERRQSRSPWRSAETRTRSHPSSAAGERITPPFYNSEPAQIQVQVPGIVQSAAGDSGNGAAAVAAELLAAGEKAKIAELCEQEATSKPRPPKVKFLKAKNNSKTVTINLKALSGGFQPQIAIVRSGTRVRFCNRDPIIHQPVWLDPARHKFRSTTLRPGQCKFFFAKILKNRKGLNKAFDRKTGRLLAPKNKPVCWRMNDKLDADALGVVYVLREGQGRPTKKDKRIARRFCG